MIASEFSYACYIVNIEKFECYLEIQKLNKCERNMIAKLKIYIIIYKHKIKLNIN